MTNERNEKLEHDYYGSTSGELAGYSIPAAEHSTITAWGRTHELEAFEHMLDTFGADYPLIAVVSDSYDIRNAITEYWGRRLRDKIVGMNAKLLIRLDSGVPVDQIRAALNELEYAFGSTMNSKGYRVLNHVGIVQGDEVTKDTAPVMLQAVRDLGFSTENLGLGMGGGLLQEMSRNSLDVAYKCSSITVNGLIRDVMKSPISDPGKASKPGRLDLVRNINGDLSTEKLYWGIESLMGSVMNTVYLDGEVTRSWSIEDVCRHAKI